MTTIPDISVLLPVYNGELTLARAVRSCLNQKGIRVQVCIVNDGSTDETAAVVKHVLDERILYTRQENKGLVGALNTALSMATGRYIIRLDADDYFEPRALFRMLVTADVHPHTFVYGCVRYHGRRNDVFVPPPYKPEDFYQRNASLYPYLYHRSVTIPYEVVSPDVTGLEDWQHVLRLIEAGQKGFAMRDTLVLNYTYGYGTMMQASKDGQTKLFEAFRQRWPKVETATL